MSITRINEFQAKPGSEEKLRLFLENVIALVRQNAGCESVRLLHAESNSQKFVILEQWSSRSAHEAAAKAIPPASIQEVMAFLAAPVKGEYFV